MVSTDPIADMLTRVRKAINVHKTEVTMPHSNFKEAVARLLKENNFVNDVAVLKAPVGKTLRIAINDGDQNARITEISRLSTPGRRMYTSSAQIPVVKRGRGLVIVSTSKGVMTGDKARQQHLGGELICKVY
jgi:small subunit ribosomal protein S8